MLLGSKQSSKTIRVGGFPLGRPEIGGEAVAPIPVEKGYDQSVRSAAFGPGPKRYSMLESTG